MKKTFQLEELDCANCAAKMEAGIAKIKGVTAATVSFFAQKLVLEGDDARWEEIVNEAEKVIKRVDSHCRLVRK